MFIETHFGVGGNGKNLGLIYGVKKSRIADMSLKIGTILRQGDVCLEVIESIPATAKRQRVKGRIVLAEGEVTGHAHAIYKGKVRFFKEPDTQVSYLEVAEALAALEHEEHAPTQLPPGNYKVVIQREYVPQEAPRRVDD
jgi:hypothetical protein